MIRAVHKTGSWVPLLHAACKQIVTSEAVGVLSAYKESFWGQRWVKCIPTVKWITELGRQSELGRDVHVVGWLGLGAGGGGGALFCLVLFLCLFVCCCTALVSCYSWPKSEPNLRPGHPRFG